MNLLKKIKSLFSKEEVVISKMETSTEPIKETVSKMEIVAKDCKGTAKEIAKEQTQEQPKQTTLKEAFAQKYPSYSERILGMFEAANLCPATWENLTKVRLQRLIDYMSERIAPNSVSQYATKFKAVLNLYSEEVELPRGFDKVLSPKKCAVTSVYLTDDELLTLENFRPKNAKETYVRNMFLIGCYCGARLSDILRLDESNIMGDTLQYVSVKTKTPTYVPLKPIVADYIRNTPKVEMSDKAYNATIRRICQKCGINKRVKVFKAGEEKEGEKWEFISSHSARKSFCSNLYLRGVDVLTISKMAGHHDIKTTIANYICCGIRTNSEELMGYFR